MKEWTEFEDAELSALWEDGLSTSEIGRRMFRSKNSVVGRAHRQDLPARASPIRARSDGLPHKPPGRRAGPHTLPPLPSVADQAIVSASEPIVAAPISARLVSSIHEMRRRSEIAAAMARRVVPAAIPATPVAKPYARVSGCLFPIGEPGTKEFRYCDEPHENKTYCDEHLAVCYLKTRRQEVAEL